MSSSPVKNDETSVLGSTPAGGRLVKPVRVCPPVAAQSKRRNSSELQVLLAQIHGVQRLEPRPDSRTCQVQLKVSSHQTKGVLVQDEGSGTAREQHESE